MMKELIWAEHQKLRRSKIVLVAIFAVIMVAIIVFTQGQFSFGEKRYIDDAGWFMNAAQSLATFFVLPAVIALLGSYMICREEQEDTIKSLRLIPISEAKMTIAKLLITFAFSVLFYLLLFGITFLVEVILHFRGLSIKMILSFFKKFWDLMSFSHWVFIIEIATRYGRWFPLDKSLRLSIPGMEE